MTVEDRIQTAKMFDEEAKIADEEYLDNYKQLSISQDEDSNHRIETFKIKCENKPQQEKH